MKNKMNLFTITLFSVLAQLLVVDVSYAAPDPLSTKLQEVADNYLTTYGEQDYISAVTLSVSSPKLNHIENFHSGYTDITKRSLLDDNSLYQVGNITKSFVAVILLQLEADPRYNFNINDDITKYLPQYSKWHGVTVKELLNMTSGVPSYTSASSFLNDFKNNPTFDFSPDQLVSYVSNEDLSFTPGSEWFYSNTNYILAGMIISKLTGHTVEEEINTRFLQSGNTSLLDLENTHYSPDSYPLPIDIYGHMVHGYMNEVFLENYFPLKQDITSYTLSWAGSAGALVSTPTDVIKWVQALYTSTSLLPKAQRDELESLVSEKTGQPINTPTQDDPQGFGLGIGAMFVPSTGATIYYYQGQTLGYRIIYFYFPNENIVIAAGVNSSMNKDADNTPNIINQAYEILSGSSIHELSDQKIIYNNSQELLS
jgi:D-alanyl-D-alanine carboxypeptidase